MCESNSTSRSTLEESYRRATTQEPIMNGGSLVSPGLATQRVRGLTAIVPRNPDAVGWHPWLDRPADYLPSGTVGQWPPVPCNGGPSTRAATRKPTMQPRGLTQNSRAGNPKRTNSHQTEYSRTSVDCSARTGTGAQRPHCPKGRAENPGVVAPFAVTGCRGNRRPAVVRRLGKFDLRPCPLRLRSSLLVLGLHWTASKTAQTQFLDELMTSVVVQ